MNDQNHITTKLFIFRTVRVEKLNKFNVVTAQQGYKIMQDLD